MSTHYDLTVPSGTTLGVAVRYHRPGARVAASALVAGQWVYYCGAPWPVYSAEPEVAGRLMRVRLGLGLWWEPDLLLPWSSETTEAVAQKWATHSAQYLDAYGMPQDVPTVLSADALTLTLVPHDDAARDWSRDLGLTIVTDVADLPAPPHERYAMQRPRYTYAWSLVATFDDLDGTRCPLRGTLTVVPVAAYVAPAVTP